MARVITKIQVSDPGPSWPSCRTYIRNEFIVFAIVAEIIIRIVLLLGRLY